VQIRTIVGDGVRELAYDIPEISARLSHYLKSILRQIYDNRMINRKIFCKLGPRTIKHSVLNIFILRVLPLTNTSYNSY